MNTGTEACETRYTYISIGRHTCVDSLCNICLHVHIQMLLFHVLQTAVTLCHHILNSSAIYGVPQSTPGRSEIENLFAGGVK